VGENEYEGRINIRVGPVQGSFAGTVRLSDIQPPNSYRLELEGQGRPGYIKGAGQLRLESNDDSKTTLYYTGEAQLSGRIASVGQRLMDSSARSITRQGLESLDKQIQARMQPAPAAPAGNAAPSNQPPAPPVAPSTAEVGLNVARDVASDVLHDLEKSYAGRDLLIVLAGLAAIVWMWRKLFPKQRE